MLKESEKTFNIMSAFFVVSVDGGGWWCLSMLYRRSRSIRTTLLTRRMSTCTRRSPPPTRLGTRGLEAVLTSADVGCTVDVTRFDPVGTTTSVSINVWNFSATRQSVAHSSSSAGDTDPKKVRTKLMKFLMKRPTLQSVKEKGYIRGNLQTVGNLRSTST